MELVLSLFFHIQWRDTYLQKLTYDKRVVQMKDIDQNPYWVLGFAQNKAEPVYSLPNTWRNSI